MVTAMRHLHRLSFAFALALPLATACGGNSASDSADNDDSVIDAQVGPDADPNAPDADPNAPDAMVGPDAAPPTGDPVWLRRGGSTLTDGATAVAVASDGSVVIGGTFTGSADFGDGFLVSRGSTDLYVVKYDAEGVIQWSRSFGGCSGDALSGLVLDDDDGVIVVGNVNYVSGDPPCDPYFDGARIPTTFAAGAYGANAVLARYDADGDGQMARAYGFVSSFTEFYDVAYDDGRVAISGVTNTTVDFGGNVEFDSDGIDGFLVLLAASDGDGVWARPITGGNVGVDFVSVALDADHAMLGGFFDDDVNIGAPQTLLPAGSDDVVIAAYARADGAYAWHQQLGGIASDRLGAISLGGDGATWLAGSFTGTAYFGGGQLTAASRDGVAARFDADGEHLASVATDTAADDEWRAVATYSGGGAALAGVNTAVGTGVAARLAADGSSLWTQILTSTQVVTPTAVAVGPGGTIVVAGTFTGTMTAGALPSVDSAGVADSFVLRLQP